MAFVLFDWMYHYVTDESPMDPNSFLPYFTPEERKRPGGAGVYYHFDYVGGPRSYKWLNTNPIATRVMLDPEVGIDFARMVHGAQEFSWGPLVVAGDPFDGILRTAASTGADVVVTGRVTDAAALALRLNLGGALVRETR